MMMMVVVVVVKMMMVVMTGILFNVLISAYYVICLFQFHSELINVPTQDGYYPIHLACMSGDVAIISMLVDAVRSAVDEPESSNKSETSNRFEKSTSRHRILKLSALVNAPDARHQTPLHLAIINNKIDAVREILAISGPLTTSHSFNKR